MTEPEPQVNIASAGCTFVLYFLLGMWLILMACMGFFLVLIFF